MTHLGSLNLQAQGDSRRVLFVCTGGMLRSATAAHIFCSLPYDWNTRCAGTAEGAIQEITPVLLEWANEIYCMEDEHADYIKSLVDNTKKSIVRTIYIPDIFEYRDPGLVERLVQAMEPYREHPPVYKHT